MRTLKRTLCLVLAMVMVLGMFGIASATSFNDDAKIQYKEAVDVMTGIGSINGMGDGTFNPAGNVTRAQAAKMVAYAVLGADVAKTLPVTASSFKDVDSNFAWATPSIEYLVKKGVINGRGNGTFDPNGNITAYEIAKMLLCAAGYGKNGEYTGNSWALNVAITAQKKGVFTGSKTTDRNAAATREECALYCFNVLTKVTMVNYDKTKDAYVDVSPAENIGEAVYGLGKSTTITTDTFARPASVWTVTGKTDPIAATAATPVASYKDASYAKAFAANTYEFDAGVKIYVNGVAYDTNDPSVLASRKLNGTGIELYNTDTDKDIDVIVLTQAYLAKVTDYTATKGTAYGNFKLAIYNPWDKTTGAGTSTATKTVTDTKKTDDLFDKLLTAGLKKNDYFMVYTNGADITGDPVVMKFAAATTATGKLSTYSATDNNDGFNGSVTVGGTQYVLASACVMNNTLGFISNDTGAKLEDYLNKNVTVILDEYGMVVGIVAEKVLDSTTYGLVVGYEFKTATLSTPASASILLAQEDGTVSIFAQPAGNDGKVTDIGNTLIPAGTAGFVSYTINNGNLVKIAPVTAPESSTVDGPYVAKANSMHVDDGAGDKDADLYFNYASTFIYFDSTKAYNATTNPVKIVKGYANSVNVADNTKINYVLDANLSAVNKVVDVMFVPIAASTSVSGNSIYIFDTAYSVSSVSGATVYTYNGFVNGKATTITTADNITIDAAGLYTYTLVNGAATSIADASATEAGTVTVFDTGYIVTDGTNTIKHNSSTTFYLVNSVDETITAGPIVPDATKTYKVLYAVPSPSGNVATYPAAAIYYTVS